MELDDFEIELVSAGTVIPPFHCKDSDLNDFLLKDAKNYLADLMAETYIFVDTKANKTVAYFSLLNDKITCDPDERRIWNRLNRSIANSKRRESYPSVKIGRLAVSEEYERNGLGRAIIDLIKGEFAYGARIGGRLVTGCRYITVDAYAKAIGFYEKNGFAFLMEKDRNDETRLMYFNLKSFIDGKPGYKSASSRA